MPTSDRRILMEKFSSSLLLRYSLCRSYVLGRLEEDLHHVVMRLLVDQRISQS
jgi:hypothetical protein